MRIHHKPSCDAIHILGSYLISQCANHQLIITSIGVSVNLSVCGVVWCGVVCVACGVVCVVWYVVCVVWCVVCVVWCVAHTCILLPNINK